MNPQRWNLGATTPGSERCWVQGKPLKSRRQPLILQRQQTNHKCFYFKKCHGELDLPLFLNLCLFFINSFQKSKL